MVKNPPANAGDTGSSPGPGRSTWRGATKPVHHNYWACTLEPVSHNYWALAPQLLKPPRTHAQQQEKPPQWEACTLQRRVAPAHRNQRKPACNNEDPTQPKLNKYINLFKKKSQDTATPFNHPNLYAYMLWLLCILILYILPSIFKNFYCEVIIDVQEVVKKCTENFHAQIILLVIST